MSYVGDIPEIGSIARRLFNLRLKLDMKELDSTSRFVLCAQRALLRDNLDEMYEKFFLFFKKHDIKPNQSAEFLTHRELTKEVVNDLWHNDRKRLLNIIINDGQFNPIDMTNGFVYFFQLFNQQSRSISFMPKVIHTRDSKSFLGYIEKKDLETQLSRKCKVCVLERISPQDLRAAFEETRLMLNMCLWRGNVPRQWKHLRITLKHTKRNASEPGNYCPIITARLMYRTLCGIIYKRIHSMLTYHENQLGFNHKLYRLEVVTLVQYLLDTSQAVIANINLVNKFNTVSLDVLIPLLGANGFSDDDLNFVRNIYENSTGYLHYKSERSESMPLSNSIRQGDTLATAFSTLLIDQLLYQLDEAQIGVTIGQRRLPAIAYSDDVILFAENDIQMARLIRLVFDFYTSIGLNITDDVKVEVFGTRSEIFVNGFAFTTSDQFKVLGYEVQTYLPAYYQNKVEEFIEKLNRCPLTNEQRIHFMKVNFEPQLIEMLRYKYFDRQCLEEIESTFNYHIKRMSSYFPVGQSKIAKETDYLARNQLVSLENSSTWFIRYIVHTQWFRHLFHRLQ